MIYLKHKACHSEDALQMVVISICIDSKVTKVRAEA